MNCIPLNEYSLYNKNCTGRYSRLAEHPKQVRTLTMIFHNYVLFRTILILILCSIYLAYLSDPLFGP